MDADDNDLNLSWFDDYDPDAYDERGFLDLLSREWDLEAPPVDAPRGCDDGCSSRRD